MGFNQSGVHHLAMPDLQSQFLKLSHDAAKDQVKHPGFDKAVPSTANRAVVRLALADAESAKTHEQKIGVEIELHLGIRKITP